MLFRRLINLNRIHFIERNLIMSFENYLWNQMIDSINNLQIPPILKHVNVEGHREIVNINHKTQTIRYKMGKTEYSLRFSDFYTALTTFHGQRINSKDLRACAKSFKQNGATVRHSSYC